MSKGTRIFPWNGSLVESGAGFGEPAADLLAPTQFTRLLNLLHRDSRLVKRPGVERYAGSLGGTCYGLTRFYPADSTDRYSVAVASITGSFTLLAKRNDAVHDATAWTSVASGLFSSSTARTIDMATLGELLVLVDGLETPKWFAGYVDGAWQHGTIGLERPHKLGYVDVETFAVVQEGQMGPHGIYQFGVAYEYEDGELSSAGPLWQPWFSQWMGREEGVASFSLKDLPDGLEVNSLDRARIKKRLYCAAVTRNTQTTLIQTS